MHEYDATFYTFLSRFALESARRIVPVVRAAAPFGSIADFGCGEGAWLSVWKSHGLNVQGIDGDYVRRDRLLIAPEEFYAADLAQPIDLGRRFDIVQSLETAEHLPAAAAPGFIASLVRHADVVLFSAAVPGQGGEFHINEQPAEYWRQLFRAHDYVPVDLVRPAIRNDTAVKRWYRFNTLLYVHRGALSRLSDNARHAMIPDDAVIPVGWPLVWRAQQSVLRHLPRPAVAAAERAARLVAGLRDG